MSTLATATTFQNDVLTQKGTVLVDFFTDGCGPCRMMSPVLDEISRERSDIKIVKVDAGTSYELAANYGISAVPTFILFANGAPKAQFVGARSKRDLLAWIESNR
ncbi:MAG TPA: thioredoxin family protein [Candidatus Acidoferrum sp.]|nr:thioredoxin family protein [Candidatus Acidoferrum sp.]